MSKEYARIGVLARKEIARKTRKLFKAILNAKGAPREFRAKLDTTRTISLSRGFDFRTCTEGYAIRCTSRLGQQVYYYDSRGHFVRSEENLWVERPAGLPTEALERCKQNLIDKEIAVDESEALAFIESKLNIDE